MQVTQKQAMAAEASAAPAHTSASRKKADFEQVFQSEAAEAPRNPARTAASGGDSRSSVQTLPPPPNLPVSFAPAAIEARMNQWLMGQIARQNQARMEVYNTAVENWKLNSARHRELGLPALPPPAPPVLEPVEPMPEGWWFQTHA